MLTSPDNPRIRAVRALHERRGRAEQGAFLIEGVTLLLEALAAGLQPRLVLRDDSRLGPRQRARLDSALAPYAAVVQPVSPAVLRAVTTTESPPGVIAVAPLPPAAAWPTLAPADLIVIADGLQDPGNLGTLLRTAEAAGVRWLITTPGSTDLFGPKVVRAAMGAHFRLAVSADRPWPTLRELIGPRPLLGADAAAARPYDAVDWTAGAALVIGNEAGGLSPAARASVDELIGIPLHPPVDSLNAAIAAAVVLFEAARQRRRGVS